MADKAGGKVLSLLKRMGSRLYGMMFKTGWACWLFIAVVAVVFVIIASLISGGTDYRRDPSALVPRLSTYFYAETRELDMVFSHAMDWPIWKKDSSKVSGGDQWNQIQVTLAGMLGNQMVGLPTQLPLIWLSGAKKAAFCLAEGEEGRPESWAIYLETMDAKQALNEIRIEPGFSLTRVANTSDGIFELSGPGAGKLFFGAMDPWLIISSDSKLPEFAAQGMKTPSFSLANSGVLPDWRRKAGIRGMINPSYMAAQSCAESPFTIIGGWTDPRARMAISTTLDRDGLMEFRMVGMLMSDQPRGGGVFWPVFKFVLFLIAVLCLFLLVGAVSVMIGWSGWLKALALKAGIEPVPAPAKVEPSEAFQEDIGEPTEAETESSSEESNQDLSQVDGQVSELDRSGSSINEQSGLKEDKDA